MASAPCAAPSRAESKRDSKNRIDLLDREWKPERETARQDQTVCQPSKSWRDGIITAPDLQTKQFKPVRIILPSLIPEGITILAGKPKIGKSWLALDVCVAVADRLLVLGDKQPVQGDVLYLALEASPGPLKTRMGEIRGRGSWPERL